VALKEDEVAQLFAATGTNSNLKLVVDLEKQTVATEDDRLSFRFEIDPFRKHCLLNGLDDVALTLGKSAEIDRFERDHWTRFPWLAAAI
jgi:3-isopropylmalate/(R)-2-methylmalate dehydratase small subunit